MSARHPQAVIAGLATILGATPLMACFESVTWLFYAAFAVVIVVGSAMAVRALRAPAWVQVLTMAVALLLYLTFSFPSGGEIARIIPTWGTFRYFNDLLVTAGENIRDEAVPISDYDGVLLLTTVGIGLVALFVDLTVVTLRRPALAGLALLAIYSVPVAVLPGSVPVLAFVAGAVGFLWLLISDSVDRVRRFGRRFTGEGRDVDLWESSPLAAAGRRLSVVGIAVAILLPVAVPGMTSGLIDRFRNYGGPGVGGSGRGTHVNLNALLTGALNSRDPVTMLRVRTTDPTPFYLRIGVAERVTEDGFTNEQPSTGIAVTRGIPEPVVPQVPGVTATRHQAEVEIVNMSMGLAPLYPQLAGLSDLNHTWYFDASTQQVFSHRSNINRAKYKFDYIDLNYTAAALRAAGVMPATDPEMVVLTEVPANPEISALVAQLTQGKLTQYDRVRAIFEYLRSDRFEYSLQTEPGSTGNALLDFLETGRGFCVQYAAAMAWLVRTAGYPARVAFGFTRGVSGGTGVFTLNNLNLHAWTEVYFRNIGWVPFDTTPSGAVSGTVATSWATEPLTPIGPDQTIPTFEPEAPVQQRQDPAAPDAYKDLVRPEFGRSANPWVLVAAAAGLAVLAVLISPALARRRLRRRRRTRGGELVVVGATTAPPGSGTAPLASGTAPPGSAAASPASAGPGAGAPPQPDDLLVLDEAAAAVARRDAHAAWAELRDTMVDYGVAVSESETPRATAARLGGLPGLARARKPALLLGQAEERACYARHPMPSWRLDEATRHVRHELHRAATRRQRLRALLFPPSVLLRWRQVFGRGVGAAARLASRIRYAIALVSPRRLLPASRR